jgi:5-hydroxyisourate hydrolase-like protein (transthyretin family)
VGLLLAVLPQMASAQEGFTVTGKVLDTGTNEPLQYAVVGIPELEIWDLTDENGEYVLEGVQQGQYRFLVLRRGYYMVDESVYIDRSGGIGVTLAEQRPDRELGPGRLVGVVLDHESGNPVADVEILVEPTDQSDRTDANGRFDISDISAGALRLTFRRIGYEPRVDTLAAFPGVTLNVEVQMAARAIELPPVVVTALVPVLETSGFYRRSRDRRGWQFGPDEVAQQPELARLFRNIPGALVGQGRFGQQVLMNRRESCELEVWVDGQRTPGLGLEEIPPSWVYAVEVYMGMDVPPEFFAACGIVLLWMRE